VFEELITDLTAFKPTYPNPANIEQLLVQWTFPRQQRKVQQIKDYRN
jgi:hypothetical protein